MTCLSGVGPSHLGTLVGGAREILIPGRVEYEVV
jgi:hypothetical protein